MAGLELLRQARLRHPEVKRILMTAYADAALAEAASLDAEVHRFIVNAIRLETVRDRDYDGLEALLQQLARFRSWQYRGALRTTFGRLSRDEVA